MGAKRFGATLVNPGINTLVMTAASGKDSVVVLNVANLGVGSTNVRVAYMPGNVVSALTNADYLVYDHILSAGGSLQVKGIAVEAGHSLVVYSTVHQVSAIAYGIESSSV